MDELREFLNGRTVGVSLDGKWMWYGVYQRSNPMADEEVDKFEELIQKSSLFRKIKSGRFRKKTSGIRGCSDG